MPFNIKQILESRTRDNNALHSAYINPQFAKVLKTIGFDKSYVKANGPYLIDADGEQYVDMLAGYGVFSIGRNHPRIKEILKEFIDLDTANLVQMEAPLCSGLLAEALVKKLNVPGLDTAFLTNSGTEANECAIKYARAATGKNRFLYLHHAFHGLSSGSLALNGNNEFRDGFGELLRGTMIQLNDLDQLEFELKKGDVAAFFFEPIQGKGVYIPNDEYLPKAQELCRRYRALFIADEIQTGMGRTGKWFAFQHWNLEPDIVCISKALSGGMVPVGATICRRWIYDKVFSRLDRCVVHSSTFGQNNMAAVAGLATLAIIEEENLVDRAKMLGEVLLKELNELIPKHEWMQEVRGKGLMVGIEFGKPESFAKKIKWNLIHKINSGLFGELIVMPLMTKHHFLTQVSGHNQDVVKLLPPFVITEEHCHQFVKALDAVLLECDKLAGPMWEMGKNLMQHAMADQYRTRDRA